MWNGTHTKAYILNSYESVMCLIVFAFPDFISDFPFYEYYVMISRYMIIMPYLFIPTLAYLSLEYFLLDIIWYMHYCAHPVSPLGFASPLAWGVSLTPLDSHVQVLELGASGSPRCGSEWRSGSVDLQPTVQSHILPGPLYASRVFS